MKRFFRAIVPAFAAVLVFVLGTTRCTSVDDTLGQNFIPPYQHMKLWIDTLTPLDNGDELLKTYLATNDTVPSSNQGLLMVGNMVDPVLGGVKASAMTDFFPEAIGKYSLSEEEEEEKDEDAPFFGFKPEADSIYIELIVQDVKGDSSIDQKFNIYELRDSLRRDSMYYFFTPIEQKADLTEEPLFSFNIGTDVIKNTMIRRKLEPTASGREFMRRLVETDNEVYANPGREFHKKFYGLYIAPAEDGPENAALYKFYLRDVGSQNAGNSSAMFLWAHNYDENDPMQVLDTMVGQFSFSDTRWIPNPNLNVNRVTFGYPEEIKDRLNDTLSTSPALETIYVQGLGGVASYLRFTDDMLERLEALKTQDGVTHSEMVINDARIYFPIADPTTENMDAASPRLGMYYTYGQPRREVDYPYWFTAPYYYMTRLFGPFPIEDYTYYVENSPQSQGSSGSRYGGYINRTRGLYEMNITGYMTMLQSFPEHTPKEIWLGPEINTRSLDYTQVTLNGSLAEENPIKIVITYTLIK